MIYAGMTEVGVSVRKDWTTWTTYERQFKMSNQQEE